MLIDADTLQQHLDSPDWVVFDCRHDLTDHQLGITAYRRSHIPGAFFAAVETVLSGEKTGRNGRHPLPDAIEFAAFLNRHGVTDGTQIVAYDDSAGCYAARLWWLARWIGLTRVAVLDGCLSKWIAEGRPLTAEVPAPRERGRVVARPDNTMVRTVTDIVAGIADRSCLVIDARAPERYRGEVETIDKAAGHIPTAANRFFKDNLRSDCTLRPAAELRREFEALLGQRRPDQVAHQCGSGVTACVNLLAMEHAGLNGSKLYVGSWSEWSSDPSRSVAKGRG